jgi:hypothetical protein
MTGSRWWRRLGLVALGAGIGMVVTVTASVVATWPRSTLVYCADQPATVRYPDGSRHRLGLFRDRPLLGGASYHLVIGRDPSLSYGHRMEIDGGPGAAFGVRTTEWTTSGVRIGFTTGHELFVPAHLFVGGR